MIDYKSIYEILRTEYGSIDKVAKMANVSNHTVANVLTGKTKNGKKAQRVRDSAIQYVDKVLNDRRSKIQEIVTRNRKINEAAALLAAN